MIKYIVKNFLISLSSFFLFMSSSCAHSYEIFKTDTAEYIEVNQAIDEIAKSEVIILGESHYDGPIQTGQGWILDQVSLRNPNYQLAWEFLNYNDQEELEASFYEFTLGNITGSEWMGKWFSSTSADHELYLPMYEVAKKFNQNIVGTNVPRPLKQKLMKGGRELLETDSEIWPFGNTVGDAPQGYWNRFKKVMGGHVDESSLKKYYLAQFYTDAYMANSIVSKLNRGPVMMVVGHFHSDYGHGLPSYLNDLGVKDLTNIRMINKSKIDSQDLDTLLRDHKEYGAVADYILIID